MSKKEKSTNEKVEFKNDLIKFINSHKEEMNNNEYVDLMGIVNRKECYKNIALSKRLWGFVKNLVNYCTTTKEFKCLTSEREIEEYVNEDDKYQSVIEEEKKTRKKKDEEKQKEKKISKKEDGEKQKEKKLSKKKDEEK